MEKVKRNGWKVAFLAVAALMCSHVIFGDAANWDPPGPPAPTMTSLDAIYNVMSPGTLRKEGFAKYFDCPPATTTTILTVPSGKRFVLRKLWVIFEPLDWRIDGGSDLHFDAKIVTTASGGYKSYMLDFPDGCAVVEGPNNLTFTNNRASDNIPTHWVGYFCDVP
jgi:hypothetical protein